MDNSPVHNSNLANFFLNVYNINKMEAPPQSPVIKKNQNYKKTVKNPNSFTKDLNPIEMVWNDLKYDLENKYRPRTKRALKKSIKKFWRK
jgi:hypothetical protein